MCLQHVCSPPVVLAAMFMLVNRQGFIYRGASFPPKLHHLILKCTLTINKKTVVARHYLINALGLESSEVQLTLSARGSDL